MKRPTRIVVFGILCLVWGGFSLLNNFGELWVAAIGPDAVQDPDSVLGAGMLADAMRDSYAATRAAYAKPVFRILTGIDAVLGVLMAGLIVTVGIALLRDRLWAVRWAKVWAYYALVASAFFVVLQARFVLPQTQHGSAGMSLAASICMLPVFWVFPVLLMTLIGRPIVTDYLRWRAGQAYASPPIVQQAPPASSSTETHPDPDPAGSHPPPPQLPPPQASDTWRDDPWNDPGSR